jgi:hypothetical protein
MNCLCQQIVPSRLMQMQLFKHNLCQIEEMDVRIAGYLPQTQNFFRSDQIGTKEVLILYLTRFLHANRYPLRWKTL